MCTITVAKSEGHCNFLWRTLPHTGGPVLLLTVRCGQLITIFVATHESKTASTMNSNEACCCFVSLHSPCERRILCAHGNKTLIKCNSSSGNKVFCVFSASVEDHVNLWNRNTWYDQGSLLFLMQMCVEDSWTDSNELSRLSHPELWWYWNMSAHFRTDSYSQSHRIAQRLPGQFDKAPTTPHWAGWKGEGL